MLTAGSRFGSYEIVALIGAGGMGEVYRARDERLQRDIALKILPDIFASDSERLARFDREAQVLASLNHPNIAAIHGFAEADGKRALVLELVEGSTLADRLVAGPLSIDDALNAAPQIAEALQFAHEQGVIHRDLKPANIKITADGVVKVLDFGLAKLAQPVANKTESSRSVLPAGDLTLSPTITSPAAMTGVGVLLGTAAYMAPEQAKGREADKRSDVWAFGCVLYEMVTGRRAFDGEDVGDTLASVIKGDVDWSALPPGLPIATRTVIERCLAKDRRKRLADISIAHFLLSDSGATTVPGSGGVDTPSRPLWRRLAPIGSTIVLTAALSGAVAWQLMPAPNRSVTKFAIFGPEGGAFTGGQPVAISPDGAQIVYAASSQLWVRSLSDTEARPIAGTASILGIMRFPVFSPDGRSVVFWSQGDRTLRTVPTNGGVSVALCEIPVPFGVSWGEDWIVFSSLPGISRVSAAGGKPELIVKADQNEYIATPRLLPGGRVVIFAVTHQDGPDMWDVADIVAQDLKSGERTVLIRGGSDARYVPTGHLLYAVSGTVRAVRFDLDRMKVVGASVPAILGVQRFNAVDASSLNTNRGSAAYSVSSTGTLIFVPGPISTASQSTLALFGRDGGATALKLPPGTYRTPRVSPDGKEVAYTVDDGKNADIWVYDLSGQSQPRRLTFDGKSRYPVWSADGSHIAFQSDRDGERAIWWQRLDGGRMERLTTPESKDVAHVPDSFSSDRKTLSFTARTGAVQSAIWVLTLADKKAMPFSKGVAGISHSTFSPDGHWLAYQSQDPATAGVLVEPFPATGAINQVAKRNVATPHHPFWSRDGKELFYLPGPNLFASVKVTTQSGFSVGNAVPLERGAFMEGGPGAVRNVDVLPNGRFIGIVDATQPERVSAPRINVVLNWFEELKQTTSGK